MASRFLTIRRLATVQAASLFLRFPLRSDFRLPEPTTPPQFRTPSIPSPHVRSTPTAFAAPQLDPGVFHCSATLTIAASGVVLRGAGSSGGNERTSIALTGDPHVGIIIKGNLALKTLSPAINITDAYIPFGDHAVHVSD